MSRRPACVAILLALLCLGAPRPAHAATPDAVAYVRLVDRAAADLEAIPPNLSGALGAVAEARRLAPSPGPALGAVGADLSRQPPDLGDAAARLRAIAVVLRLPENAAPGDDAAARQRLDDVYGRPAFARLDQPHNPSLLAQVFDGLRRLAGGAGAALGPVGSVVAGAAVLLLALALVLRLARGATGRRVRRVPEERREAGADPEGEWSAALAAAAAGDHREAVRRAFRSALLGVALRGRLPVDASWTTRELLARAAGDADLLDALAPAAAAFDRAWYSGEPVGEADWLVARDRCAAVRRLAQAGRVTA